jgi:hypothetical protein
LTAQVAARLAPLALRPDEAKTLLMLISEEEEKEGNSVTAAIKKANTELLTIQEKLDRLTRAYLDPDKSIDGDSFQTVKAELILQKTTLKAEKDRLQKKRINSWIEPARDLISTLQTLGTMPDTASPQEIANNLRKIGTNPFLANKTVTFSFSENYVFIPSLLASARSASPFPDPKRCGNFDQSFKWCTRQDLNLQPFDPKSNALSN